jgi:hypothetical protein
MIVKVSIGSAYNRIIQIEKCSFIEVSIPLVLVPSTYSVHCLIVVGQSVNAPLKSLLLSISTGNRGHV